VRRVVTVADACDTVALCGGPYSNFAAVEAFLAATSGLPHRFCLGICATHSGLPWTRAAAHGFWCNVGVLGRSPHDGTRRVGYALLRFPPCAAAPVPELVPLDYNAASVATAMRAEGLPEAFAASLELGVWTTCAGIMPPAERAVADRYASPSAQLPVKVPHARHAASPQVD